MHSPNKKSMEQALSLLELLKRTNCSESHFPQKKSPRKLYPEIKSSHLYNDSPLMPYKYIISTIWPAFIPEVESHHSRPCLAPLGSDATLLTLPLECAQLSVLSTAAVGYSRGSDG